MSAMLLWFNCLNNNNKIEFNNSVIAEGYAPTGEGTEENPFQINDVNQLKFISTINSEQDIKTYWGESSSWVYYKLNNNIVITDSTWDSIGNYDHYFYGSFDGLGHTITFSSDNGVTIDEKYAGVFGYLWGIGIYNLGIIWDNGGLKGGSSATNVGGLIGGGAGTIKNCFVSGKINGQSSTYVGGFVGYAVSVNVYNSYNSATVTCPNYAGGIMGYAFGASYTYTSYNIGMLTANQVGAVAAFAQYGQGIDCFYLSGTLNGTINSKDSSQSKTSSQLKTLSTYAKWNDFETNWAFDATNRINNGYPYLKVFYNYTIVFDIATNGGNGTNPNSITIESGNSIVLPTPSTDEFKTGWLFVGWSENKDATTSEILNTSYTPKSSVTLYAIYKKDITVNYYQLGSTDPLSKTQTIYNNEKSTIFALNVDTSYLNNFSITAIIKSGWTITLGSEAINFEENNIILSENATLYAVVQYSVVITYKANGGDGSDIVTTTYNVTKSANMTTNPITLNATVELIVNPFIRDNYNFVCWSTEQNATSGYLAGESFSFDNNTTFYAIWKLNSLAVHFNVTTNMGVILTIIDENGSTQQIFIDKSLNGQTFTLALTVGQYRVAISTFYTTNIELVTANENQVLVGKSLIINVEKEMSISLDMQTYVGSNWIII